jgi:chorismate synthase
MLRYLSAGESHGKALVGIIEGMVAGLEIDEAEINRELGMRKKVYGRGKRASFEEDKIEILSGVIEGKTIGSPICLKISNKEKKFEKETVPRPGHADLPGVLKYDFKNIHFVAERASARETAMRVAIGSVVKKLLFEFAIDFFSHTLMIGGIRSNAKLYNFDQKTKNKKKESEIYCLDEEIGQDMIEKIDEAERKGDSLGGACEVLIKGLPPGIGSYVHYERRLDYRLGGALMSIPSVKAVEIGEGIQSAKMFGSMFHDALSFKERIERKTNNAGGIEGGVSNGEMITLRLFIKPVPTLKNALISFDIVTKKRKNAPHIRSDVCVVPAVGIIGEAVSAWEMASSFLEKFGGDTLAEVRGNFNAYKDRLNRMAG